MVAAMIHTDSNRILKSVCVACLFFYLSITAKREQLYIGQRSQKTEIAHLSRALEELELGGGERLCLYTSELQGCLIHTIVRKVDRYTNL